MENFRLAKRAKFHVRESSRWRCNGGGKRSGTIFQRKCKDYIELSQTDEKLPSAARRKTLKTTNANSALRPPERNGLHDMNWHKKNWWNVALLYIPKPQWTTDLCDILFLTTSSMEYIWKPNLPLYAAEDSVKWKLFPPAVKLIKSFCTVFCIFWNHCI